MIPVLSTAHAVQWIYVSLALEDYHRVAMSFLSRQEAQARAAVPNVQYKYNVLDQSSRCSLLIVAQCLDLTKQLQPGVYDNMAAEPLGQSWLSLTDELRVQQHLLRPNRARLEATRCPKNMLLCSCAPKGPVVLSYLGRSDDVVCDPTCRSAGPRIIKYQWAGLCYLSRLDACHT